MNQNQYDKYDKIIGEKVLDIINAVKRFYRFTISDNNVKKSLGITIKNEDKNFIERTKKYYNSLCNEETSILGFVANNISFEKVCYFDESRLLELNRIEYEQLKPYLIKYIIDEDTYLKARDYYIKREKSNSFQDNEKVAIKSGYYFDIFNKNDLPSELSMADYKVELDGVIYDLYKGNTLEQERLIDSMFNDEMGYSISEHKVITQDEEELDEPE